jgi:hypothetical protein
LHFTPNLPCMTSITRMLFGCILLFTQHDIYCTPVNNTEDFVAGKLTMAEYANTTSISNQAFKKQKKEERSHHRSARLMVRLENALHAKIDKRSINGISDPVDRWLWIWGISWGAGILITLFAGGAIAATGIGILWLIAFSVGAVSLILWLVKKFG